MDTKNTKIGITMSLVFFALMSLLMPVDLVLNTDAVFEDPAKERIKEEGLVGNKTSQLILKIKNFQRIFHKELKLMMETMIT